MSRRMITLLVLSLLGAACHRSDQTLQRQQQQYDVVKEGANGTVTSSIGEGTAPLTTSTSTDTAADTTTKFSLGNPRPTGSTSTASIAGTLPGNTATANGGPVPDRIRITRRPRPVPAETSTTGGDEPATASSREPSPPASSDTAGTPATTTTGSEPPAPRPAERKREEPPPPPPPTDTTGTQGL